MSPGEQPEDKWHILPGLSDPTQLLLGHYCSATHSSTWEDKGYLSVPAGLSAALIWLFTSLYAGNGDFWSFQQPNVSKMVLKFKKSSSGHCGDIPIQYIHIVCFLSVYRSWHIQSAFNKSHLDFQTLTFLLDLSKHQKYCPSFHYDYYYHFCCWFDWEGNLKCETFGPYGGHWVPFSKS